MSQNRSQTSVAEFVSRFEDGRDNAVGLMQASNEFTDTITGNYTGDYYRRRRCEAFDQKKLRIRATIVKRIKTLSYNYKD